MLRCDPYFLLLFSSGGPAQRTVANINVVGACSEIEAGLVTDSCVIGAERVVCERIGAARRVFEAVRVRVERLKPQPTAAATCTGLLQNQTMMEPTIRQKPTMRNASLKDMILAWRWTTA